MLAMLASRRELVESDGLGQVKGKTSDNVDRSRGGVRSSPE
jgi:hypothetical protein